MASAERQAQILAHNRRLQLQTDMATGRLGAKDRFGADLRPGQAVLYRPPVDLVFRVLDVVPSLNPNDPPGTMQVVLAAKFPIMVRAGMLNGNMVAIGISGEDQAPGDKPADEEKDAATDGHPTESEPAAAAADGDPDVDGPEAGREPR